MAVFFKSHFRLESCPFRTQRVALAIQSPEQIFIIYSGAVTIFNLNQKNRWRARHQLRKKYRKEIIKLLVSINKATNKIKTLPNDNI